MSKFKNLYILGEGYPDTVEIGSPYFSITLTEEPKGKKFIPIKWPEELWDKKAPKYRLVLEKVDNRE